MNNEIWKDVIGYSGHYKVSNLGRIKSIKFNKERILKQNNLNGYKQIRLYANKSIANVLVHRIVAEAFIENIKNYPQVNHKDEDKTNNNVDNLEWCSSSYNNNYGTRSERVISTIIENRKGDCMTKTFPLQFTEEYLNEIRCKAERQNKTIKQFIMDLIQKEMEKK
jgi:hypothetical protein